MLVSNGRASGTWRERGWILKIGEKMFQNSVPITERHAGTANGAASARKFLPTRTRELRVEIEASGARRVALDRQKQYSFFVRS
jgi:hypothetical protein